MRLFPPRLALLVLGAVVTAALATTNVACFDLKKPTCAFSCAQPPHSCPQNYTCGDDGLCYRDGADPTKCPLTPPGDAAADAGANDDAR